MSNVIPVAEGTPARPWFLSNDKDCQDFLIKHDLANTRDSNTFRKKLVLVEKTVNRHPKHDPTRILHVIFLFRLLF